jgi:ribonuclease HI
MLTKDWKIRANKRLIEQARELAATFANLRFGWIPGHAGIAENERCDALARAAIQAARSSARPGQGAAIQR